MPSLSGPAPVLALALSLAIGLAAGEVAADWAHAVALERSARSSERDDPMGAIGMYLEAAREFERHLAERPGDAHWRAARATWLAGDTLPLDAEELRLARFARAEQLAEAGERANPRCAECLLWRFSSMGRLRTTRGVWRGLRQLPEMGALLDRAIALDPGYADDTTNSTLGNLHYSSAIFYRILPDWWIAGWFLGIRGDKERALEHARTALSIHPERLDYQIELGTQLLCSGTARKIPGLLEEGRATLGEAILRTPETQDDAREIAAARFMLSKPRKACGYSGDTFVEVDRKQALRAAKRAQSP